MRRFVTLLLASAVAFAGPLPAHADVELELLQCTGTTPDGALRGGSGGGTGTITCTGSEISPLGVGNGPPSFTATTTFNLLNESLGHGLYVTSGSIEFAVNGVPWTILLPGEHLNVHGVVALGYGQNGDLTPYDIVFKHPLGEANRFFIREGYLTGCGDPPPFVSDPCESDGALQFTAEWLHDLPL
jgi:hypothetical protein